MIRYRIKEDILSKLCNRINENILQFDRSEPLLYNTVVSLISYALRVLYWGDHYTELFVGIFSTKKQNEAII